MEISTGLVRFSEYRPSAVLKIGGSDAFSFLQGQFTQDLRLCDESGAVVYGLWLDSKGHVEADSYLTKNQGVWWCVSLFSTGGLIRERLEKYIIADDVWVEEVTASWSGLCVLGADVAQVRGWAGSSGEALVFAGRRGRAGGCEWLVSGGAGDAGRLLEASGGVRIAFSDLERLRIDAGVPRVPQDVGPGDLPQEGGLERDAVCFTKGCFLGQEVMARLRSMGRLRRRLMRVRGEGALSGGLPAALYREGVRCGELRSVYCTEEGYVGLAMISLPVLGACRLLSLSPEGPANVIIQE